MLNELKLCSGSISFFFTSMNKKIIYLIITVIIVGAGAFYGGMKYAQSKSNSNSQNPFSRFANLSPEEMQTRMQQFGGQRGIRNNGGGGVANGEILSKDETGITIKLRDGGSKIILVSASTQIAKSSPGTLDDLTVGKSVMVNGSANQDGSISATSVQIRSEVLKQQ